MKHRQGVLGMSDEARWRRRTTMFIMTIVVLMVTLIAVSPLTAQADQPDGTQPVDCYKESGADPSQCLPSGRWAGQVGTITTRTESAGGWFGGFTDGMNQIKATVRTIMPNMLLQVTQVFWNSALSLSQFAASFTPMDSLGKTIDSVAGTIVDNVMAGGIPATFLVLGILGWVGAASFNVGGQTSGTMLKRIFTTLMCLAIVMTMGAAAKADVGKSEPTVGSPWWVVKNINSTMNMMAGSLLDPSAITDNNPSMMAYGGAVKANCQKYLYYMHQDYKAGTSKAADGASTDLFDKSDTSAVTSAINTLWEETSLRSWVTMQYGATDVSEGNTSTGVASNALQSYCHVLEDQAGTSTGVQLSLTNRTLSGNANSRNAPLTPQTGRYLLSRDGFIDPWDPRVNKDENARDTDTSVARHRMNLFWQTCSTNNGKTYARDGWKQLINNLGDDGSGAIRGTGGAWLRASVNPKADEDQPFKTLRDNAADNAKVVPFNGNDKTVDSLCTAVFDNKLYTDGSDHDLGDEFYVHNPDLEAAILGWTFDVPNTGGTWREANLDLSQANQAAARASLERMYGNVSANSLGAFGTVLGSLVNFLVWGMFSLALLLSKIMLCFCMLTLILAFLLQAFPLGDKPRKALLNWGKSTCSYSMIGVLYSAMGFISCLIVSCIITACGGASGTFFYNLLVGCSPAIAILTIIMTCKQLKIENPFTLKAVATMAGAGALAEGLSRAGRSAMHAATIGMAGKMMGLGKAGRIAGRLSSSQNAGGGAGESAEALRRGMDGQQPPAVEPAMASKAGNGIAKDAGAPASTADGKPAPPAPTAEEQEIHDKVDETFAQYADAGVDPDTAATLTRRNLAMQRLRDGFLQGANARNPLRKMGRARLMQDARKVAKVGLTGAAFLNPITAPLGLIAAGRMATRRATWATVGRAAKTTGRFAADMAAPTMQRAARTVRRVADKPVQAVKGATDKVVRFADKHMTIHPVQWGRSQVQAAANRIDTAKLERQASKLHALNHKYGDGTMSMEAARAQVGAPRMAAPSHVQPQVAAPMGSHTATGPGPIPTPPQTTPPDSETAPKEAQQDAAFSGEQEHRLNEALAQLDLGGDR